MVNEFETWLKRNREKLPAELLPVRKTRLGREYQFRDVPHISFSVTRGGSFSIVVTYRNKCIDLLGDFDIVLRKSPGGAYFCSWCRDEGHAFYAKHRLGLLARHCFEPFLEWCLESIRRDRYLVMQYADGGSWARVCPEDGLKNVKRKPNDEIFVIKPVFGSRQGLPKARDQAE